MAEPVRFEIRVNNSMWSLTRDGQEIHSFGHADRAVHEAAALARDLIHTGQPAEVRLYAAEGQVIEVDLSEPARVGQPGDGDERSAVVPDRSASA